MGHTNASAFLNLIAVHNDLNYFDYIVITCYCLDDRLKKELFEGLKSENEKECVFLITESKETCNPLFCSHVSRCK